MHKATKTRRTCFPQYARMTETRTHWILRSGSAGKGAVISRWQKSDAIRAWEIVAEQLQAILEREHLRLWEE